MVNGRIDWLVLKCQNNFAPRENPKWSWGIILFVYCWIWFAKIVFRIFAFVIVKDIDLWFSLPVLSWSGFDQDIDGLIEWVGEYSAFDFLEQFVYHKYFFLKCLIQFTSETTCAENLIYI